MSNGQVLERTYRYLVGEWAFASGTWCARGAVCMMDVSARSTSAPKIDERERGSGLRACLASWPVARQNTGLMLRINRSICSGRCALASLLGIVFDDPNTENKLL